MKAYVYILKDEDSKYYVGSTVDLDRRLKQHLNGHTKTTSRMKNIRLVLKQEYNELAKAREIERKIKKLKRKDYLEKMVTEGYIRMR